MATWNLHMNRKFTQRVTGSLADCGSILALLRRLILERTQILTIRGLNFGSVGQSTEVY